MSGKCEMLDGETLGGGDDGGVEVERIRWR